MVDKDILQRKLAFIDLTLGKLEHLKTMTPKDFLVSFQAVDSAKYNLQVSIEAVIDVATHIVARERWGVPASAGEAVKVLMQHGVLEETQAARLTQMIKFRNRIVHLYQEVDDQQIYIILQENLGDFRSFVKTVLVKFL